MCSHGVGGFPGGASDKEPTCQETWFDPWVRKFPCRRTWQPIPVFSPGESPGQRNMVSNSPEGHKESDMTKATKRAGLVDLRDKDIQLNLNFSKPQKICSYKYVLYVARDIFKLKMYLLVI